MSRPPENWVSFVKNWPNIGEKNNIVQQSEIGVGQEVG